MTLAEQTALGHYRTALAELNAAKRRHADLQHQKTVAKGHAFLNRSPESIDIRSAKPTEVRDASLKALEIRSADRLESFQIDALDRQIRAGDTELAIRTIVTTAPAYRSAIERSLREEHPHYTPEEASAVRRYHDEVRSASEGGSFGLALPVDIDPSIVPSSQELATLPSLVSVKQTSTNVYKPVISDGSGWGFQAENAVVGDNTPTLVQPSLAVQTARAFIPVSDELFADYGGAGFLDEYTPMIARGFADLLTDVVAVGTGTGQPRGIFTALQASTTSPAHVTVTTAGSISAADVRRVWNAVPERFKGSSTFVLHTDVLSQIRNDSGAAAQVDLVVDRAGTSLFGRPCVTSSYCPDFTGTTGAENFLAVGDLSGYHLAVRQGVTVEMVPVMFDAATMRPIGSRGFLALARVAGDLVVPNSMRLLANS
ncbi:MAG: phage major capsid protein [Acidimicrobiales bacterium]|nr:phage major capsid protein [Acidimicrobiales bacterium]